MLIELLHNKIVKDTITDGFVRSVENNLIPKLEYVYGESLLGVRMYEDYLSDGFLFEGEWYYPLTVLTEGGAGTRWISWSVDKKRFTDALPYSYVGEDNIDFKLATDVPEEFRLKLVGRAITYTEDTIPVKVHAVGVDARALSGKYSQTFVDELARQITEEIGGKLGVEGLSDSSLELQLVFAPGTYMEHTSENVTYRRLLMTGRGCQARDFWVRWERLGAAVGYSVSDHPSADTVTFTLGEDVAQKIREKEYRFLCGSNPEKYQSAMGKRTVTEWRELIKTALKRGELTKVPTVMEKDEHIAAVDDKLRALLASMGVNPVAPVAEPEAEYDQTQSELERIAFGIVGAEESEDESEPEYAEVGAGLSGGAVSDALTLEDEPDIEYRDSEYDDESDDLLLADEAEEDGEALADVAALEPEDEYESEPALILGEESFDTEEYEPVLTLEAEPAPAAEQLPDVDDEEMARLTEARLRRELEEKIRRELEAEARAKAEEEQRRMQLEYERLARENERLAELARQAEQRRVKEEEARRLEAERIAREREERRREEELRRQREEERFRLEAQERERLAETARLAVEEQRRLEAEKAEREARAREEAFRLERERLMREEQARRDDERRREEERRRQAELEAKRAAVPPVEYVSKYLKLRFARLFDMNILKRIKEIVEETIVAEGKTDVKIAMKAYPVDSYTINLDIAKIPKTEERLLLAIVQALGNGRIGISKIVVE